MNGSSSQKLLGAAGLGLILIAVFGGGPTLGQNLLGLSLLASKNLFWWAMFGLVPFYVLVIERRPLSSVGLMRPTWKTLAFGVGGAVALFAAIPLVLLINQAFHLPSQRGSAADLAIRATPFWFRLQLVLRAALAEEIVFRGFAMERVRELTGSRALGLLLPLAVFVVAHAGSWGWSALVGVGVAGLVLSLLYLWRRDLGANMIAHFVIDGLQLLL